MQMEFLSSTLHNIVILLLVASLTNGETCLFRKLPGHALLGHNHKQLRDTTVEKCKNYCLTSLTGCRSLDYNRNSKICYLSTSVLNDYPNDFEKINAVDYFEKVCGNLQSGCLFYELHDYAKYGGNHEFDTNLSAEECKRRCLNYTQRSYSDQVCYSVDYDTATRTCFYDTQYGHEFNPEHIRYSFDFRDIGPMKGSIYFERLCEETGSHIDETLYEYETFTNYGCNFVYPPMFDQELTGHQYKTLKAVHFFDCSKECSETDICQSYNYRPVPGLCELNEQTARQNLADVVTQENSVHLEKNCDFVQFPLGCPTLEYFAYGDYCYSFATMYQYGPYDKGDLTRQEAINLCESANNELLSIQSAQQMQMIRDVLNMYQMYDTKLHAGSLLEALIRNVRNFWTSEETSDSTLDSSLFAPKADKTGKYISLSYNYNRRTIGLSTASEDSKLSVICQTRRKNIDCPSDLFQCSKTFDCIDPRFLCDNVKDCGDGSDESTQHCVKDA